LTLDYQQDVLAQIIRTTSLKLYYIFLFFVCAIYIFVFCLFCVV